MAETSELTRVLTHDTLRQLADGGSFERGQDYFASGQVVSLVVHDGKLSAMVQGSEDYRVKIRVRDHALDYDCSCPVGAEGAFCKHCVAVGLAWLANAAEKQRTQETTASHTPVLTLDNARVWLANQEKSKLVEMLLEQAVTDAELREKLILQAAKTAGPGANVTANSLITAPPVAFVAA